MLNRKRFVLILIAIGVVVAVVLSQVKHSDYKMVKVGGEKSQCECTQRLER